MGPRLLILHAGTAATSNVIRSLRAGDATVFIAGCHDDAFILKNSGADRNFLVPSSSRPAFVPALCRLIKKEHIDLLIPNSDADVSLISGIRAKLPCRVFLPRKSVIARCQDKYALTAFLARHRVPVASTYPVTALKKIELLFARLSPHTRLWCRIRKGTSSWGSIPVTSAKHARDWITYWQDMRGVPRGSFTLSEYLPGRDYCLQSLWSNGRLIMAKAHERLTYHVAGGNPSGTSSTAALAQMVFEPVVSRICAKAIRALDANASGIFFTDLKENAQGVPCITEINAGRFANVSTIHDATSSYNMTAAYMRLALGESVAARRPCRFPETCYVRRDIDMTPGVFQSNGLFDGMQDLRARAYRQSTSI